eukprot:6207989-Pleurochrysis_carterae.AAC.2
MDVNRLLCGCVSSVFSPLFYSEQLTLRSRHFFPYRQQLTTRKIGLPAALTGNLVDLPIDDEDDGESDSEGSNAAVVNAQTHGFELIQHT